MTPLSNPNIMKGLADIAVQLGKIANAQEEQNHINRVGVLVESAHRNAIEKGWHKDPRSVGELIALMHSELSEALEDHRNGREVNEIYYEGDKPCGIPTELADTVIRIFDFCGLYDIDLEEAIQEKMAYNATRPQRHGGKVL